jgi:hypothetical protein
MGAKRDAKLVKSWDLLLSSEAALASSDISLHMHRDELRGQQLKFQEKETRRKRSL